MTWDAVGYTGRGRSKWMIAEIQNDLVIG